MTLLTSDVELHSRRMSRRRWLLRLSLALFLASMLVAAGVLATLTSGLTIEEAKARVAELKGNFTRTEIEKVFGPPHSELSENGYTFLVWGFYRQSFNKVKCYSVIWLPQRGDLTGRLDDHERDVSGQDAWLLRWYILKWKLGFSEPGKK